MGSTILISLLNNKKLWLLLFVIVLCALLLFSVYCGIDLYKKFGVKSEVNGTADDSYIISEETIFYKPTVEGDSLVLLNTRTIDFELTKKKTGNKVLNFYSFEESKTKNSTMKKEVYDMLLEHYKTNYSDYETYVKKSALTDPYLAFFNDICYWVDEEILDVAKATYNLEAVTYDATKTYFLSINGMNEYCSVYANNYIGASFSFHFVLEDLSEMTFNLFVNLSFNQNNLIMRLSGYGANGFKYFNSMLQNDGFKISLVSYDKEDLKNSISINENSSGSFSDKEKTGNEETSGEIEVPTVDNSDISPIMATNVFSGVQQFQVLTFELEYGYSYRLYCSKDDIVFGMLSDNENASALTPEDGDIKIIDTTSSSADLVKITNGYYLINNHTSDKRYLALCVVFGSDDEAIKYCDVQTALKNNYIRLEKVTK